YAVGGGRMPRDARGWLVMRTEARRLARRPSMWAIRWAWAIGLVALVGAVWMLSASDPRLDAPRLGQRLFWVYGEVLLVFAVGVGPVVVALGAAEDHRDPGRPLLVLAGLGDGRAAAARVLARLLAV